MAGQDIRKLIPAGGGFPISTGGDYIYLKVADRPIDVIISGGRSGQTRVTMEAGDKYRPGSFESFEVENPDKNNPAQIVFTVGEGDYNRQIVQGEIVVDPRVKTGTGEYVSDTRAEHNILVNLDYKREPAVNAGDGELIAATGDFSEFPEGERQMNGLAINEDGQFYDMFYKGSNEYFIRLDNTGNVLDTVAALQPPEEQFEGAKAGVRVGNTVYVAGNKFISRYAYGRTNDLTSSDQINDFEPESGSWEQITVDQITGDVIALDTEYKAYNVTQEKKLFNDDLAGTARAILSHNNKIYLISHDEYWHEYTQSEDGAWSFERVDLSGFAIRTGGGAYWLNGAVIISDVDSVSGQLEFHEVEPETFESGELHYGRAIEQCTTVPALLNPAILSEVRTPANVSVAWENGNAYVSGEVIKAVLDLLGIDTSGNYLDGITAFKAVADGRTYNINLGGRTFAADKIDDDFTRVLFPQVIELTALESLWSNRK